MVSVADFDEFAADAVFGLVKCAPEAAFAIDQGLTVVSWNAAAQRLLGYAPNEVVGRRCSDVLRAVYSRGEPLCGPSCEGARCFRHFETFTATACHVRHKDGGWVRVNMRSVVTSGQVRKSQTGSAIAVIFFHTDEETRRHRSATQVLRIFTLGRFGLATGGRSLAIGNWQRKQALTLLKILVTRLGRAIHREVLIEHLWPEAEERSGRERLKVTVYALRRELRAVGIREDIVETVGEAYLLRREAAWLDAELFERGVAEGSKRQHRRHWREALQSYGEARRLYRGDYMEEDVHADWCAEERERLREIYLEMMVAMAECHAALGHHAEAVSVCRSVLVADPCREGTHRALMTYLARLGHIDAAAAQYRHCRRVLAVELGVEPMPETCRLYQNILAGEAGTETEKPDLIAR